MKILCIVPTLNAINYLPILVRSLKNQNIAFDIAVIDSSSEDGTYNYAKANVDYVLSIDKEDFNHGGTRQAVVEKFLEFDIYVFLTQDVYLKKFNSIRNIVNCFSDNHVGAVCGRQLPHSDANYIARHARAFSYPEASEVRTKSSELGMKTVFMSNSFAAYRATALADVGGFPVHVILAEDMYVTAKMVLKDWKIAYAGNACCHHSHNYKPWDEFKRYFDIGVFHGREQWIRKEFGGAGGEGLRYIVSELKYIGLRKPLWACRSLLTSFLKLLGYKMGQLERYLPLQAKKTLSMHKRFWDSEHA